MKTGNVLRIAAAGAVAVGVLAVATGPAAAGPTCSTTLGIAVHGQHIVGDYVVGGGVGWPPSGAVGSAVGGRGAIIPGGPGPGFHFEEGFAPGASFCLANSRSPGMHPGLG
jgi:hypothetical protein